LIKRFIRYSEVACNVHAVGDAPVTLMAASLPRTPLRELIGIAAAAGFDGLTLWPNMWRHALRRDGLTLKDVRDLLDEHGVTVTDVEMVADWRPSIVGAGFPSTGRVEAFEVARALGARTLDTAHAVSGELGLDRDAVAFAQLCDDAAEHGLRVALEFVPFTAVPDLGTALELLRRAGRPNAGLVIDLWHLARSGSAPGALADVPPELIYTVQLADGPASPHDDLIEDARSRRQLPGAGELRIAEGIATLRGMGVEVPIGPEVFVAEWADRPREWAEQLYTSTRALLDLAGVR
jgi:sugar phosphate isomerase/epimerase